MRTFLKVSLSAIIITISLASFSKAQADTPTCAVDSDCPGGRLCDTAIGMCYFSVGPTKCFCWDGDACTDDIGTPGDTAGSCYCSYKPIVACGKPPVASPSPTPPAPAPTTPAPAPTTPAPAPTPSPTPTEETPATPETPIASSVEEPSDESPCGPDAILNGNTCVAKELFYAHGGGDGPDGCSLSARATSASRGFGQALAALTGVVIAVFQSIKIRVSANKGEI